MRLAAELGDEALLRLLVGRGADPKALKGVPLLLAAQGEDAVLCADLLIKSAFVIGIKDWGYIPLHQQALAWGVSKKVKLTQRPDNQVLLYWATKQE